MEIVSWKAFMVCCVFEKKKICILGYESLCARAYVICHHARMYDKVSIRVKLCKQINHINLIEIAVTV
jgi:hypothetical protein